MGGLIQRNKDVARRKGWLAAATAVGGTALALTGAPIVGLPVVVLGAYFGYDWFLFRAKNGMRF